jgi:hypothetical protein
MDVPQANAPADTATPAPRRRGLSYATKLRMQRVSAGANTKSSPMAAEQPLAVPVAAMPASQAAAVSTAQISTILNALQSIDKRLMRIETALGRNLAVTNGFPMSIPSNGQLAPPPTLPSHAGPPTTGAGGGGGGGGVSYGMVNGTAPPAQVTFTPLEPPPEGFTVSSRATMQEELDQWTLPRGYSMRIAGAKVTGKKKVRWLCYRGGQARHHRPPVDESLIAMARAEGRRKPTTDRTSKKCGCMFKFELIEAGADSDIWTLHYPNGGQLVHNHPPSDETQDPRARKLPGFVAAEVDGWLREGRQIRTIQNDLKARGFTNVLDTDLYNRKKILAKDDARSLETG